MNDVIIFTPMNIVSARQQLQALKVEAYVSRDVVAAKNFWKT